MKTFIGAPCDVCGEEKRYVKRNRCVNCQIRRVQSNKRRSRFSYNEHDALAKVRYE